MGSRCREEASLHPPHIQREFCHNLQLHMGWVECVDSVSWYPFSTEVPQLSET